MTGAELRSLRRRLGWSQAELGWHLDLSRNTISKYERRRYVPAWLEIAAKCLVHHGGRARVNRRP